MGASFEFLLIVSLIAGDPPISNSAVPFGKHLERHIPMSLSNGTTAGLASKYLLKDLFVIDLSDSFALGPRPCRIYQADELSCVQVRSIWFTATAFSRSMFPSYVDKNKGYTRFRHKFYSCSCLCRMNNHICCPCRSCGCCGRHFQDHTFKSDKV